MQVDPILHASQVPSGICQVDGVVILGVYRATAELDEDNRKVLREQLGSKLVVHRVGDVTFLATQRGKVFVSGRRLRRLETKHRCEFSFLSLAVADVHAHEVCQKDWLTLNRGERLQVCAHIAQHGPYLATEADVPAIIATSKPKPVVPAPEPDGLEMQWIRGFGFTLAFIALLLGPFAAMRGLQLLVGSVATVIICYSLVAVCVVNNKLRKREVAQGEVW